MPTNRLQLTLIPERRDGAQPLPPSVRNESIELVAKMLLQVLRPGAYPDGVKENGDESR
jgi:hypothetical protein